MPTLVLVYQYSYSNVDKTVSRLRQQLSNNWRRMVGRKSPGFRLIDVVGMRPARCDPRVPPGRTSRVIRFFVPIPKLEYSYW